MPFTPFVGLSILAHIGVIIGHRLFNRAPEKEKAVKKDATKLVRAAGFMIIVVMFLIVLTTATALVRESVIEHHSTVHFVERLFTAQKSLAGADESKGSSVVSAADFSCEDERFSNANPSDCPKVFNEHAAPWKGSVADYLAAKGYDPSFAARVKLAPTLGIADYRGTVNQNMAMLLRLFLKFRELPECGASTCK